MYKGKDMKLDEKTSMEINTKRSKQITKSAELSDNIFVECPQYKPSKKDQELSAEELSKTLLEHCAIEHEKYVNDATYLKEATNGQINLFRTGTFKRCAQHFFFNTIRTIVPEPILRDEAVWLRYATMGAVLYCKKGYKGESHYADFKSFYPAIMKRQQAKYPIKRGEFKTITNEELNKYEFYQFGIYRAIVDGDHKLFRFNNMNYYTHTDLTLAKSLGFEIELIEDNAPNFLYYSSDKLINGNEIFGKFVNTLYVAMQN